MIFISYSSMTTFFSSCDNNEKSLTLATKMIEVLGVFFLMFSLFSLFLSSNYFSSLSKELVVGMGLLSWYLCIFGCLRGIDISRLFWFLFLLLTSIHISSMFVFCELCILCFEVWVSFALFIRSCLVVDLSSESNFFLL